MAHDEFCNTFLAKIKTISEVFEDPEGVESAMKCMMKRTKARIHAIYVKDLLQSLLNRGMGTPEVYSLTKRLYRKSGTNTKKQEAVTKLVMKDKVKDSWGTIRKERHQEQQQWRTLRRTLQDKNKTNDYNEAWAAEKDRIFNEYRTKRKDKIA